MLSELAACDQALHIIGVLRRVESPLAKERSCLADDREDVVFILAIACRDTHEARCCGYLVGVAPWHRRVLVTGHEVIWPNVVIVPLDRAFKLAIS